MKSVVDGIARSITRGIDDAIRDAERALNKLNTTASRSTGGTSRSNSYSGYSTYGMDEPSFSPMAFGISTFGAEAEVMGASMARGMSTPFVPSYNIAGYSSNISQPNNHGNDVGATEKMARTIAEEIINAISGNDTNITVNVGGDTLVDKVVEGLNRKNRLNGQTIVNV